MWVSGSPDVLRLLASTCKIMEDVATPTDDIIVLDGREESLRQILNIVEDSGYSLQSSMGSGTAQTYVFHKASSESVAVGAPESDLSAGK